MSTQSIQSQDIKISDVFQGFYSVPDYQREYVWQSEQVEQLLTDIYGELNGSDPASAPEYFIGSIVVCPGKDEVFDLIDGQQRMTTLFLTLCAIRDRFAALGSACPGALGSQISTTAADAAGRDVFRYRLDLQYEDSGDVLVKIANRELDQISKKQTRSIGNILTAYESVIAFLTQQFGTDIDLLRAFYGYFINKVKLIRIETIDVAKALKIFETINDRGVGLDSMDLLKNLLFMKSQQSEFENLKKVWKELQDTIFEAGEKPLRFLRYFIFSQYRVEILREDEIYGWFSKNQELCGYSQNPLKFARELLDAAKAYACFLDGRDPSGKERPELQSLQYLGGSAARQHLILLLAGRHLGDAEFSTLVRAVESLFFVYVVSRENTREFERNFARWAPELRSVSNREELDGFLERRIVPAKAALSSRFVDAFRRMTSFELQAYRLRYILAKFNQYFEIKAYGETEGTKWLKNYVSTSYQIEHIHPSNPSAEAILEFGPIADPAITNRLGNLVLMEQAINGSFGNKRYSEKRPLYSKSNLLFVQAIANIPKIGVNTSIDRAVRDLVHFEAWNEEAVLVRQEMLSSLALEIWDVPEVDRR